jgi:hypothetical protein
LSFLRSRPEWHTFTTSGLYMQISKGCVQ